MAYGKALLEAATMKAGSRYALARLTGIDEGDLSKAAHGKREVPASWVLKLARVAEVDPTEAMESHDLERAEKKRARQLLSRSAVAGVAVMLSAFAVNDSRALSPTTDEGTSRHGFDFVYIVSTVRALLVRLWRATTEAVYQDAMPEGTFA